jgi:hypothetical protein
LVTSVLLLTLLLKLHCQPGVIGSVSFEPVANVEVSDVLNVPLAFVAKSRSKPEAVKSGRDASGRTGDSAPAVLKKFVQSKSAATASSVTLPSSWNSSS